MKKVERKYLFLFVIFVLGLTSITLARTLPAYDYWWHTKAGEYMVLNKAIPYTDVFSWYGIENSLYWHSHEWLTEVVLYLTDTIFGSTGEYIFCIVTSMLLMGGLVTLNGSHIKRNVRFAIVWFSLGILVFMPIITARPHMISFLLLMFTMKALMKYRDDENSKWVWSIPVISMLWANFHGGSSNLPYVLTFLIVITGMFNFKLGRLAGSKLSKKQLKTLIIVGVLSIGAIAINPHGLDMISYPYINMQDDFMLSIINEWRSPDLKNMNDIFIFIELFVILLPLLLGKDELDLTDLGFIGGLVYLTFKSIRFSVLLYIISTFIIFKYIPKSKDERDFKQFSVIFSVVGCLLFIPFLYTLKDVVNEPLRPVLSDNIVNVIKEKNPERLYNDYDFGGYLIYNDIKVFVDGRADMYSSYNLKDAINLSKLGTGVEEILDKYNFDLFVIYENSPLNYLLQNADEYNLVLSEDGVAIYETGK